MTAAALESTYAVVFLDAIRSERQIVKKAGFIISHIDCRTTAK